MCYIYSREKKKFKKKMCIKHEETFHKSMCSLKLFFLQRRFHVINRGIVSKSDVVMDVWNQGRCFFQVKENESHFTLFPFHFCSTD